jgi:sialic acid synthase SpsE
MQSTNKNIFADLFVLELANNHWGKLERGLKIIEEFSKIVRFNNVRAAIKLQFRDVEHFIHRDFQANNSIRYIKKTRDCKLPNEDFATMVKAIKAGGCIPMATPFDEVSVDLCEDLYLPFIKVASSSINDWPLIEKIAKTKKPVIVSTGGSSQKDLDDLVMFFNNRHIPLGINHCVSLYPSENSELEMNQIDYLINRYPGHVIGFSTHEYHDWETSITIGYAKGARMFERHIDIDDGTTPVSPYCSLPAQIDTWFKAYKKAQAMCGAPGTDKRLSSVKEIKYLDLLVRGIYAKRDLPAGYKLTYQNMATDVYAAVPLQQGQISCRELMCGEVLLRDIPAHAPLKIDDIDCEYAKNPELRDLIYQRGIGVEDWV